MRKRLFLVWVGLLVFLLCVGYLVFEVGLKGQAGRKPLNPAPQGREQGESQKSCLFQRRRSILPLSFSFFLGKPMGASTGLPSMSPSIKSALMVWLKNSGKELEEKRALKINPGHANAYLVRAFAYECLGRKKEIKEAAKSLSSMPPKARPPLLRK
ncbi:MAG: hypothetical protein ACUVTO_03795 [Candidatus Caldatribacteriaceae bacterium]